jgi:hypothetical protein
MTMSELGTAERIALLFGVALGPLGDRLESSLPATLLELGLDTTTVGGIAAIQPRVDAAVGALEALPELVTVLVDAIDNDEAALAVLAKTIAVIDKVRIVITALDAIGTQLSTMTLPGGESLTAFAQALPARLFDLAVISYLDEEQPLLYGLFSLVGVIDFEEVTLLPVVAGQGPLEVRRLRLDRIGTLLGVVPDAAGRRGPEAILAELYGWGTNAFDAATLLDRLRDVLLGMRLPVARTLIDTPRREALVMFLATIAERAAQGSDQRGLEAIVSTSFEDGSEFSVPLGSGVSFLFGLRGGLDASLGIAIVPPAQFRVASAAKLTGSIALGIAKEPATGESHVIVLGAAGGPRIQAQRLSASAKAMFSVDPVAGTTTGDFGIEGRIDGGRVVISLDGADGFLGTVLAGIALDAPFDLAFGWSAGGGVYFSGSGGLEIHLPAHIRLGPVEITNLSLRIGIEAPGAVTTMRASITTKLGPLQAVIDGIGARASLRLGANQQQGPIGIEVGFVPPKGIGLSLDVGIVKGGGYLFIDAEKGEYAGALEFVFAGTLALRAVGLITTKTPDGRPGFSLIAVITAEFPGGIQLGFGFTLLGVGGIIGWNRTMNLDTLMTGVRTGAVQSIMFPQNVVANAPRILADLATLFPQRDATFLIGPMVKLGWGTPTLISASVGVIIEIPGNIALVGVIKVALPTEDAALLVLQVNFAGALEFDKKRLYFFASIFESRILTMTLEGEIGLLIAWGDHPEFIVTAGGFHPRFNAPALPFPSPKRMAISILDTSVARLRAEAYFAVTSNTVQFGSRVELRVDLSALRIDGHLGFDALFQFSPFHFIIDISAGVSLKVFGLGLFSISLELTLEGPTPWRARGTGTLELLFFDVSADFELSWGTDNRTLPDPIAVVPLLERELNADQAWTASIPNRHGLLVTLRPGYAANGLVLHPVGTLRVSQKAVPLDVDITKIGAKRTTDVRRASLQEKAGSVFAAKPVDEAFALAQYVDVDDATKLTLPSFEAHHGGITLTPKSPIPSVPCADRRSARFEELTIDGPEPVPRQRFMPANPALFDLHLLGGAITRSSLSKHSRDLLDPHANATITTTTPNFVVASTATNTEAEDSRIETKRFTSAVAAQHYLAGLASTDPAIAEAFHILPTHELIGA